MLQQKVLAFVLSCLLFPLGILASERITLITTISPCPSYPRTIFLEISQYSFMRNIPNFEAMPKIIVCDGVRNPEDATAYAEFKERLQKLAATHPHFQNTKLIFCNEFKCLVGAVKEALKAVTTEYVFLHQDDFELVKPLDLEGLICAMDQNHNIKHVRLNSGVNLLGESNSCDTLIDDYIEGETSFPLLRTGGWSDNDHIARKDYYDDFVMVKIGEDATFMEHVMNRAEMLDLGSDINLHTQYGTYLYGTFQEGPFIYHLDRKSSAW